MKVLLIITLALVVLAAAKPGDVFDFDGENAEHEQDGAPGSSVTGEYKWESPEGNEFLVKYIADNKGYRVLESNAVPTADGVPANGEQADLEGDENDVDK